MSLASRSIAAGDEAQTVWEASAPAEPARAELIGGESVEVAIVGAGVAGLSLALHLAGRGVHTAVIEAREPGAGATGRSAGLIVPYLTRHTPASVQAKFGYEKARALLQLVSSAANYTFDLIGADAERCGAIRGGFLSPVRGTDAVTRLRATISDWRTLRGDIEFLDEKATRLASGCVDYDGALFDPSGGALNPLAYARFLAQESERRGAAVFCNSAVVDVSRDGEGWRLRTARGSLAARMVVLCANGGNTSLHAALARTVLPMSVIQVATSPVSGELRHQVLPDRQALTDMEPDVFSIRYEPGGRLITAYPVLGRVPRKHWLDTRINARLRAKLPAWRTLPLEYTWQGVAWLNSDLLPRLVNVAPDLYAVQACNGRGLAFNTVLGRHLGDWLAGGRRGDLYLELRPPQPIHRYFLARHVPGLLMKAAIAAQRFRGSLRRPTSRAHRGA